MSRSTHRISGLSFRVRCGGRGICFFFLFCLLFSLRSSAQVATGAPAFGSFAGGPDIINLGNNNAHITVPVLHKPGRGLNFNYDLSYDSSVWYPVGSSGNQTWQPVSYWGWSGVTQAVTGTLTNSGTDYTCQM